MRYSGLTALSLVFLSSCARIDSIPINSNGEPLNPSGNVAHGIRYYVPKPYLLVMALPASPTNSNGTGDSGSADQQSRTSGTTHRTQSGSLLPGRAGSSRNTSGSQQTSGTPSSGTGNKQATTQANTPAASASDVSFSASTAQYVAKLIYLPDYTQPMVLQANPGLFGTASISPNFQDGWMLTSLNGQIDSGGSNVLQTVQSLVSAAVGSASKAATTMGGSLNPGNLGGAAVDPTILPPGLYAFNSDGTLNPVDYFCSSGAQKTPCAATSSAGASGQSSSDTNNAPPPSH